MLTVLHLITGLETGGAQRALARLVAHGDMRRVRSVVVSMTGPGTIGPEIVSAGADLRALDCPGAVPGPRGLIRLAAILRQVRPDIMQTWLYHADLLGLVAKALGPVPHLLWNIRCSEVALTFGKGMLFRLLARLSAVPDAVVVNSRAGRLVHRNAGYRPRRWELIPNGFDLEELRPDPDSRERLRAEWGCAAGSVVIGLPARLHPMKDHATFFAAAARLAQTRPEVMFVLIGAGLEPDNPELQRRIPEELRGRVKLLGQRADMAGLYPALDIACLCSAWGEGFPNVIAEAMACGIPCVATDSGDTAELIGSTGVVVARRDTGALAEGWDRLVGLGAEGRRVLGREARARIARRYGVDRMVAGYERLYHEIAAGAANPVFAGKSLLDAGSRRIGL